VLARSDRKHRGSYLLHRTGLTARIEHRPRPISGFLGQTKLTNHHRPRAWPFIFLIQRTTGNHIWARSGLPNKLSWRWVCGHAPLRTDTVFGSNNFRSIIYGPLCSVAGACTEYRSAIYVPCLNWSLMTCAGVAACSRMAPAVGRISLLGSAGWPGGTGWQVERLQQAGGQRGPYAGCQLGDLRWDPEWAAGSSGADVAWSVTSRRGWRR